MFTDMVGYTAIGQRNESLSLALVEEQSKLLRPIFLRHNGREVKTMGDAFLVEFPSALDAVQCAYDVQRATREFNIPLPVEQRLRLRIGIHLGDIVESRGDISGDAVNVASRIEPLAEEGGVCLTRQVYDQVQSKFDLPMTSLGLRTLKNVNKPLEIFQLSMPWYAQGTSLTTQLDKRRIAVLPFVNMSPDPADQYFADGMMEELITSLSGVKVFSVIARTSVMRYKGSPKGASEIGEELSAGTLIEGSVRKAGNRVRITLQLIDAKSQAHVWARNYDREIGDIFTIQNEIAESVAKELSVQLDKPERQKLGKRPTESTEAYMLYLKGRYFWNERSQEGLEKAVQYFTEATRKDPNFARAHIGLAECYLIMETWGFLTPAEASTKYRMYTTKALELDESVPEAQTSLAVILLVQERDVEAAERAFKRATELNPSYSTAHQWYATYLLGPQGRSDEAIAELREAERLDPLSPMISINLGDQLLSQGRSKEAQDQYRKVVESSPDFPYAYSRLGLALLKESRYEEAILEIRKSIELFGNLEISVPDLIYAYSLAGQKEEAQKLLAKLRLRSTRHFISSVFLALAHAGVGDNDKAIEFLRIALDQKSSQLRPNINEPQFDRLRSDPRFQDLLRTLGIRTGN